MLFLTGHPARRLDVPPGRERGDSALRLPGDGAARSVRCAGCYSDVPERVPGRVLPLPEKRTQRQKQTRQDQWRWNAIRAVIRWSVLTAFAAAVCSARDTPVVASEWVESRQAGRFLIRAAFPIDSDPSLAAFLRHLDEHEADIVATLGLKPSRDPVFVSLFANRRSYVRTVRSLVPAAASRRAVFVSADGGGQVYCYRHPELLTDLRHELTHAVLHSMLPFLPLWLDEGLAEYFEVPPARRASGHPSQKRVVLAAKIGLTWRPSLAKLEKKEGLPEVSLRNYREAWAWVHFLLHGPPEATELLQRYLLTIQAEQPPGPFSAHLRQLMANPEQRLTEHLKSWK